MLKFESLKIFLLPLKAQQIQNFILKTQMIGKNEYGSAPDSQHPLAANQSATAFSASTSGQQTEAVNYPGNINLLSDQSKQTEIPDQNHQKLQQARNLSNKSGKRLSHDTTAFENARSMPLTKRNQKQAGKFQKKQNHTAVQSSEQPYTIKNSTTQQQTAIMNQNQQVSHFAIRPNDYHMQHLTNTNTNCAQPNQHNQLMASSQFSSGGQKRRKKASQDSAGSRGRLSASRKTGSSGRKARKARKESVGGSSQTTSQAFFAERHLRRINEAAASVAVNTNYEISEGHTQKMWQNFESDILGSKSGGKASQKNEASRRQDSKTESVTEYLNRKPSQLVSSSKPQYSVNEDISSINQQSQQAQQMQMQLGEKEVTNRHNEMPVAMYVHRDRISPLRKSQKTANQQEQNTTSPQRIQMRQDANIIGAPEEESQIRNRLYPISIHSPMTQQNVDQEQNITETKQPVQHIGLTGLDVQSQTELLSTPNRLLNFPEAINYDFQNNLNLSRDQNRLILAGQLLSAGEIDSAADLFSGAGEVSHQQASPQRAVPQQPAFYEEIPVMAERLPLSSQIRIYQGNQQNHRSNSKSARNGANYQSTAQKSSPTKMSSLSRSPNSRRVQNSQEAILQYFGVKGQTETQLLNQYAQRATQSSNNGESPARHINHMSAAPLPMSYKALDNLHLQEDANMSRVDANKLIEQELGCSPLRVKSKSSPIKRSPSSVRSASLRNRRNQMAENRLKVNVRSKVTNAAVYNTQKSNDDTSYASSNMMMKRRGGSTSGGPNSTSNQRRVAFDLSKKSVPLRRHHEDMPLQVDEPPNASQVVDQSCGEMQPKRLVGGGRGRNLGSRSRSRDALNVQRGFRNQNRPQTAKNNSRLLNKSPVNNDNNQRVPQPRQEIFEDHNAKKSFRVLQGERTNQNQRNQEGGADYKKMLVNMVKDLRKKSMERNVASQAYLGINKMAPSLNQTEINLGFEPPSFIIDNKLCREANKDRNMMEFGGKINYLEKPERRRIRRRVIAILSEVLDHKQAKIKIDLAKKLRKTTKGALVKPQSGLLPGTKPMSIQQQNSKLTAAEKLLRQLPNEDHLRTVSVYLLLLSYFSAGEYERVLRFMECPPHMANNFPQLFAYILNQQECKRNIASNCLNILALQGECYLLTGQFQRGTDCFDLVCHLYNVWNFNTKHLLQGNDQNRTQIPPEIDQENQRQPHLLQKEEAKLFEKLDGCALEFGVDDYIKAKAGHAECLMNSGHLELAIAKFEGVKRRIESEVVFDKPVLVVNICNQLGNCFLKAGELMAAQQNFEQSLRLINRMDNRKERISDEIISKIYLNLGILATNQADHEKAIFYHEKCLELSLQQKGSPRKLDEIKSQYENLAQEYHQVGLHDQAITSLEKALQISKQVHMDFSEATAQVLIRLSEAHNLFMESGKATDCLEHAGLILSKLETMRHDTLGKVIGESERQRVSLHLNKVYLQLVAMYYQTERVEEARQVVNLVEARLEQQMEEPFTFKLLNELANELRKQDDLSLSVELYKKALLSIKMRFKNDYLRMRETAKILINIASTEFMRDEASEALRYYEHTLNVIKNCSDYPLQQIQALSGQDFATKMTGVSQATNQDQQDKNADLDNVKMDGDFTSIEHGEGIMRPEEVALAVDAAKVHMSLGNLYRQAAELVKARNHFKITILHLKACGKSALNNRDRLDLLQEAQSAHNKISSQGQDPF